MITLVLQKSSLQPTEHEDVPEQTRLPQHSHAKAVTHTHLSEYGGPQVMILLQNELKNYEAISVGIHFETKPVFMC